MNCSDRSAQLHGYLDGELSAADARAFETHLARCENCRRELAALRALRAATTSLAREAAPARDLWPEISAKVARRAPAPLARGSGRSALRYFMPLAAAAAIAVGIILADRNTVSSGPWWNVASLDGAPRVDAQVIRGTGQMRVGQWLETDRASRAKVEVGAIGQVNVEPNSRLRLVDASATDHRLELARGEMHALIWAPPRLFFVNTPSATAIDLGCAYTLKVDDRGAGELRVTAGYVALEHDGRESIIPAGQACLTRRGAGPGTPFAADASDALRRALERFDFENRAQRSDALAAVLAATRPDDYVTLWHLLARAEPAHRGEVFDALAKDHPAPEGVTRAGIVAGDAAMRRAWADALGLASFPAQAKR